MSKNSSRGRITLSLRFRLTVSYLTFFAVLFGLVGVAFRQILATSQESQNRQRLEEQWGALRGYLRFRRSGPVWSYNREKPEELLTVERLRRVFLLADAEGQLLEVSPSYRLIGPDSPEEIRQMLLSEQPTWRIRRDREGAPYLIHSGVFTDRRGRRYYAAIGRSLLENQAVLGRFTRGYFLVLPFVILTGGFLGWFLAGRALQPLNNVAEASQRITGSNLSFRIPLRGAGDELDRLIETFNRMMERLEESFEHMRQFTTDVSHEMRTPITAIRGQLEVALFSAKTAEEYREAVLRALEEAEHLSQFVKAMLQLSQAESGQLALQKAPCDLSALVQDLVDQFQIPAEEAQVRLRAELPAECGAEVDRIQIERLVTNLLTNAVKHTPRGGEVRVCLATTDDSVTLAVEDTGCGIPPEHLPHIFDRFYRVPQPESVSGKGIGLGLSFVQWIVKAHGGQIELESAVGKGTRFVVTLPARTGTVIPLGQLTPDETQKKLVY